MCMYKYDMSILVVDRSYPLNEDSADFGLFCGSSVIWISRQGAPKNCQK